MSEGLEAVVRVAAHPFFGRRGPDLTVRVPVTLAEAALGTVVTVPTLDGAVAIRVPPGTPHGRVLRVAGRGIAHRSRLGDLLVTLEVVVPTALTDRQRSALEAFAEATPSPRAHLEGHRGPATANPPSDPGEGAP
jgi:molecular chaperone DnaJ